RSVRGLQSYPLAADGVLYYSGSYNQVWALDGATGEVLWQYKQKLNEDLVAKQTHSPYNRGIALGYGNVYIGTLDGKLAAIDMKTGKLNWETKLVNSEKLTVGFTGAPLLVKDKVIVGAQGGEWPDRGPIFGVDANTGKQLWRFYTAGGEEDNGDARNTWLNDSWRTGGGFGWVYDRNAKVQNVWRLIKNINFVQDIKPNGELVGRRDMTAGKHENLCPFIAGGMSWNMGSYNPKTGLLYKVGNEWCMDLEIAKTTPILEPMAQLNIGANFNITNLKRDKAHGHVSGRDPITGKMTWEVKFHEPPLASLLSSGGDLLFGPDPR